MTEAGITNISDAFGKLNFLIIDDFDNFRLSLREMLRSFGAENIEAVPNAAPAIQYCLYNPVDVVLCDFNLGEEKNGQHILEELRHRKLLKRSSLFLMVTAETSKDMVMGARENQPDAYLTKPLNRAMLENRLGNLIQQRQVLYPINREIEQENYPEAVSLCRQALHRHPRYKTWLLKTLGELYLQLGDLAHAARIYQDVLDQREIPWARLGYCRVLLAQQSDDAIPQLRQVITSQPDYMEAYDLLAEALERQGKLTQAQMILEQATEHSPNALLRHRHLAQVAESTQDIETAAQAWRRVVTLGTHSIHDSPEHYLALSQNLADLSGDDHSDQGAEHANEAHAVLNGMVRRFPESPNLGLRSQIIQCRIHAGQGQSREADTLLEAIQSELSEDASMPPDVHLDYAKTLFRLKQDEQAKTVLAKLAQRCANQPSILQKIETLLDEPVGFHQKLRARTLNQEGIKAFEGGDLTQAAQTFAKALEIVPDHVSLNLNLVQVLLRQYRDTPQNRGLLSQCRSCLDRLSGLPEQHRQYRRYCSLSERLKELNP